MLPQLPKQLMLSLRRPQLLCRKMECVHQWLMLAVHVRQLGPHVPCTAQLLLRGTCVITNVTGFYPP
jgi:hypothetical protein